MTIDNMVQFFFSEQRNSLALTKYAMEPPRSRLMPTRITPLSAYTRLSSAAALATTPATTTIIAAFIAM
jgi:hypothetical protein